MHAGFTWLGCGSFIPRIKVQRFLAQLGSAGLGKDRLRLADMYFSIWTNQYPYQLSNPLTPLEQKEGWSDGVDQWTIVYQNIVSVCVFPGFQMEALILLGKKQLLRLFVRVEPNNFFIRCIAINSSMMLVLSCTRHSRPILASLQKITSFVMRKNLCQSSVMPGKKPMSHLLAKSKYYV